MLNEYTTETRGKEREWGGEKRTKQSTRDTGSYQAGEEKVGKGKPEADRGFRSSRKGKP